MNYCDDHQYLSLLFKSIINQTVLRKKIFQSINDIHSYLIKSVTINNTTLLHGYNSKVQRPIKTYRWDQVSKDIHLLTRFGYFDHVIKYLEYQEEKYSKYNFTQPATTSSSSSQQRQPYAVGLELVMKQACLANSKGMKIIEYIVMRYSSLPEVPYILLYLSTLYDNQPVIELVKNRFFLGSKEGEQQLLLLQAIIEKNIHENPFLYREEAKIVTFKQTQVVELGDEDDDDWSSSSDEEFQQNDETRNITAALKTNSFHNVMLAVNNTSVENLYILKEISKRISKMKLEILQYLYEDTFHKPKGDILDRLILDCIAYGNEPGYIYFLGQYDKLSTLVTNKLCYTCIDHNRLDYLIKVLQRVNQNLEQNQPLPDTFITTGQADQYSFSVLFKKKIISLKEERRDQFEMVRYIIECNHGLNLDQFKLLDDQLLRLFFNYPSSQHIIEVLRYLNSKGLVSIRISTECNFLNGYLTYRSLESHASNPDNHRPTDLDFIIKLGQLGFFVGESFYSKGCKTIGVDVDVMRYFSFLYQTGHISTNGCRQYFLIYLYHLKELIKNPHILEILISIHGRSILSGEIQERLNRLQSKPSSVEGVNNNNNNNLDDLSFQYLQYLLVKYNNNNNINNDNNNNDIDQQKKSSKSFNIFNKLFKKK